MKHRQWALALGVALAAATARAGPPSEGAPAEAAPEPASDEPAEVVVHGERPEEDRRLTTAEAKELPGAFGDPLRALEMMPGVSPIATGLPYFYLRGAPPGNVGYFLDGVRVPTLFHLAAGPSVIHPRLIDSVTLRPGPYPARFGRFGAGIVTAETAPPATDFGGEASVRLVDAGAFLEAPFAGYRGHAAVAGRYSYTGTVLSLIVPEIEVSYWDYQARAGYDLSPNDTLGILVFGASDFLSELRSGGEVTLYDTSFHRVDLRYDRKLGGGSTFRLAATVGADSSKLEEGQVDASSRSIGVRSELFVPVERRVKVRAGADAELARYELSVAYNPATNFVPAALARGYPELRPRDDVTGGIWLDIELLAAPGIRLEPGVRLDLFDSDGTTLAGADPRFLAEFEVNPSLTFSEGIGIVHQRPSFTIPLAGVQPVTDVLQKSLQASSGVRFALPWELTASVTGYAALHLDLDDPIASSRLFGGDPLTITPTRWQGRSWGVEVMIARSLTRKLGGHLAYTLARSDRSLAYVRAPAPFDRTHVVSGAVAYDLGRRWRAGARGSFYTGIPMEVAYAAAAADPPRTSPFWRLDWRVEKSWPLGADGSWSVVLEVLNTTLNREALRGSCSAYVCKSEIIGPVTVPSLGVEASF